MKNQEAAELQAALPYLPGLPPPGVGLLPQLDLLKRAGKCAGGFVVKETLELGLTASADSSTTGLNSQCWQFLSPL